jgi:hypothetical protein
LSSLIAGNKKLSRGILHLYEEYQMRLYNFMEF